MPTNSYYLSSNDIAQMKEIKAHHPLNPNSEIFIRPLADAIGLSRMGVHLVRLKPSIIKPRRRHPPGRSRNILRFLSLRSIRIPAKKKFI